MDYPMSCAVDPRLDLERCYAVRYSGHGCPYRSETLYDVYDMTYAEAEASVLEWRVRADTIGGDAIIVRDPSKPIPFRVP